MDTVHTNTDYKIHADDVNSSNLKYYHIHTHTQPQSDSFILSKPPYMTMVV
jgi:hypothetical protein